ncbi:MAG TPA: hypothetical protein VED66_15220 [Candidatus Sulfotelmatobacter sp.]|nr:hypothetical protein [Candidatus Sulfotelmatobacter sp.]
MDREVQDTARQEATSTISSAPGSRRQPATHSSLGGISAECCPDWSAAPTVKPGSAGRKTSAPVQTPSPGGRLSSSAAARAEAERKLVRRVFIRCDELIQEACRTSSVRGEFLGALTANESGGDPTAVRFEPSVYRHLKALAAGERTHYGGIGAEALCQELTEVLHPKTGEFHAVFLNSLFMAGQASELSRLADEALRELASSWGFVQIMGFHVIGRNGTVRDLREPRFHYRFANQLLAEFAEGYQLDIAREFAELFRCWNTGRPDGKTADPAYVENGLRRMEIYRELIQGAGTAAGRDKP